MRRCVVSLGVGQRFAAGVKRLGDGLRANGYDGTYWLKTAYHIGCPTHEQIPFGFKPWMINEAREHGFDQVLWMDSACTPVYLLDEVFARMALSDGILLPYSPNRVWEWCSDACAEKMGVSPAKLSGMCPSVWACVMGFDFTYAKANEFFDRWLAYSRDGVCFHGAFTNDNGEVSSNPNVKGHRHDQTVAGIMAFQMGIPFTHGLVEYDFGNTLLLDRYEPNLRQPGARTFILAQHDVKTSEHSE